MTSQLTMINAIAEAHGWTVHAVWPSQREYRRDGVTFWARYTASGTLRSAHRIQRGIDDPQQDVWPGTRDKLGAFIDLLGGVDTRGLTQPMVQAMGWHAGVVMGRTTGLPRYPRNSQRAALVSRGLLTPGTVHHFTEAGHKAARQLFPEYRSWCDAHPDQVPTPPSATLITDVSDHVGGGWRWVTFGDGHHDSVTVLEVTDRLGKGEWTITEEALALAQRDDLLPPARTA